ncbi:hypothetical protein Agub_g11009, partial [Astrephomene gubernaculifera]
NRAYARHMAALEALTRPDLPQPRGARRSNGRHGGSGVVGTGRPASVGAAGATNAAAVGAPVTVPRGVYLIVDDPTAAPLPLALYDADSDDSLGGRRRRYRDDPSSSSDDGGGGDDDDDDDVIYISDGGGGGGSVSSSSSSSSSDEDGAGGRDDEDEEELLLLDSDADGRGRVGGRRRPRSDRRRRRRLRRGGDGGGDAGGSGGGGEAAGGSGGGRPLRRSSRRERSQSEGVEGEQEQERIRRSARLCGRKRRYGAGDGGDDSYGSSDDDDVLAEEARHRKGDEEYSGSSDLEEEAQDDDEYDSDAEAAARQRLQRQRQRERERERRAALRAQRELRNEQRRQQRREAQLRRQQMQQQQRLAAAAAAGEVPGDAAAGAAAAAAAARAAVTAAHRGMQHAYGGGGGAAAAAAAVAQEVEQQEEQEDEEDLGQLRQVARKRSHEAGGSRPRPLQCYMWLQCTSYQPDFYCPQLGDELVYVRAAHEGLLESSCDTRTARPWLLLPGMRPFEPCMVTELGFEVLRDGTLRTAANLKLQLGPASGGSLAGVSFSVQLPPPAPDQPEFLVPLPRFLRAVGKGWRIGERCQVYWLSGNGGTTDTAVAAADAGGGSGSGSGGVGEGRWCGGVVVGDRLYPTLTAAQWQGVPPPVKQPYQCEELWERYTVQWDDGDETCSVSPWDMLPATSSWEDVVRYSRATAAAKADEIVASAAAADSAADVTAGPSASSSAVTATPTAAELGLELGGGWAEEQATAARRALERLLANERLFGLFFQCPPPTATFPCSDGDRRPVPYNVMVPLPLGLDVVQKRLQDSFYRSLAAVRHDVDTIVSNAERFNGADSLVAQRAREMRLHFTAALTGRSVDDMVLFGSDVVVHRRRRRHQLGGTAGQAVAAAVLVRRARVDLSRLWAHVALDVDPETVNPAAAEEVLYDMQDHGGRSAAAAVRAGAVRGGVDAAGGFTGPRRRGGLYSVHPSEEGGEGDYGAGMAAAATTAAEGLSGGLQRGPAVLEAPAGQWLGSPRGLPLSAGLYGGESGGEGAAAAAAAAAAAYLLGQEQDRRLQHRPSQQTRELRRLQQQQTHFHSLQGGEEVKVENLEEGEGRRPRRNRSGGRRRGVAALYGSDDDDDDGGHDVAAALGDDSSDDFGKLGLGDDDDDESYTDSEDERGRRRGQRRRPNSQRSLQSPAAQRRRQRQQQQPVRRSSRARQRTRFGSDWEDDEEAQEGDSESDDGGNGGGGGGGSRRRSARCLQRSAAATGATGATETVEAARHGSERLPPTFMPPPPALLSMPPFAAGQGTAATQHPMQMLASFPSASALPAAPHAGVPVSGGGADAGGAGVGGNTGRIRIRLRNQKDPPGPPPLQARPSAVMHSASAVYAPADAVQGLYHQLPYGQQAELPASRTQTRAAAAAAAAAPSPPGGGRSRRAAAVAAEKVFAAAAAAAAGSDDDDQDEDTPPPAAAPSRRLPLTHGVGGGHAYDNIPDVASAGPFALQQHAFNWSDPLQQAVLPSAAAATSATAAYHAEAPALALAPAPPLTQGWHSHAAFPAPYPPPHGHEGPPFTAAGDMLASITAAAHGDSSFVAAADAMQVSYDTVPPFQQLAPPLLLPPHDPAAAAMLPYNQWPAQMPYAQWGYPGPQ